jgi:predicted solute-binding protein
LTRTPEESCELVFHEPAALAAMLEAGMLDAALIPGIEFLRGAGGFIVKGPALVAKDRPGGISLVSNKPLGEIRRIAVNEHARTPVAVLRIVLDLKFGMMPDICVSKDDRAVWSSEFDAVLLSGDESLDRLKEGPGDGTEVFDITGMWYELTPKPLVFAVWAFNDEAVEEILCKKLVISRNLGMRNLSLLADGISQTSQFPSELLYSYLSENWNYDLGEYEYEGLKQLEEYALEYRLMRAPRLTERALLAGE